MTEIIYSRPAPDELDEAGQRVKILRHNISVLRSEVESLGRGWAPLAGDDSRFRDVEGLLTAALVLLHESEVFFPQRAEKKRVKLTDPSVRVEEGFQDERRENALVDVWWWDKYHQDFGPDLVPMPWRAPNQDLAWRRQVDREDES